MSAPTPPEPQGKLEKGVRGFELDAHITFSGPHSTEEVGRLLRGFGARVEPYGTQDVRGARVTGQVDAQLAREQLRALLESGVARRIEIGLHGFMRSATGSDRLGSLAAQRGAESPGLGQRGLRGRVALRAGVSDGLQGSAAPGQFGDVVGGAAWAGPRKGYPAFACC